MALKNIWIYGAGGVGGVIGGKIAHAVQEQKLSYSISFIARGEHLKEIQKNGLTLKAQKESFTVKPDFATDNLSQLPSPDLIFICVKSYDLDSACQSLKQMIQKDTVLIPLLNGVDIYERMRKNLPDSIILPSCIYVSAFIEKPGTVSMSSPKEAIISGKDPKHFSLDIEEILSFFKQTGLFIDWQENPIPAIWKKYLMIASFGLMTSAYKKTFGQILENQELVSQTGSIIQEIINIAEKKGISFPQDTAQNIISATKSLPYDAKTSYQRDLEIPDKPNEGDLFGQTIIKMGQEMGVNTPVTKIIFKKIQI